MFGKLKQNATLKNFSITGFGVALSQIVALLSMPLIAKVSGADQFGVFNYYFSIATILVVICSLRMESVLFLIGTEHIDKLTNFFKSYYFLSCFLLFIPLYFLHYFFSIFEIEYLFVLCVFVYFVGCFEYFIQYNVRCGHFYLNAKLRVLRAAIFPAACLLFEIFLDLSAYLIIISYLISNLLPLIIYRVGFTSIKFRSLSRNYISGFSSEIKKTAIFQVPGHFARTIASALIIILAGSIVGNDEQIGYFSLAFKLMIAPASIFILAVGDVFKRTLVSERNNALSLINKISFVGALLFLLGVVIVEFLGAYFIRFIMGNEWLSVVDYMRALYPLLFATIVFSPITVVYLVLNKQQYDLSWQIYNLVSLLIVTIIAMKHSVLAATLAFSVLSAINLSFSWMFCYSLLRKIR